MGGKAAGTGSQAPDRAAVVAFFAMSILAGANAVGIRFTNVELAPFWGAALRFSVAVAVLLAIALVVRPPWPRGRALTGALVYGALNFGLSYAFIYLGLVEANAGTGQVMLALVPLLTIILAVLHGVERFRPTALAGALVAAAGMAVIFADQISTDVPLPALLALLASAVAVAETGVAVKWFPANHPVAQNLVGMVVGVAILISLSVVAREPWTVPSLPETWVALLYLGIVGSAVVFLLVIFVLNRWTASATSYTFLILPLVTIALGALLLGERVTLAFGIGGMLVLAGVYLGAFAARDPVRTSRP